MSKFYKISRADFADKHGDFELLAVQGELCIVQSADELGLPFVKLEKLPQDLEKELNEKLTNAKATKIEQINAARDEQINAGVEYKGKVFQSAEKDRNLLVAAAAVGARAGKVDENFVWISKDNEQVPFTLDDIFALGALLAQNESVAILKARNLKDKVALASTLKEVQAISWL